MVELCRISKIRKYNVNPELFLIENDISFYLLGAYMTDGNICDRKHHVSFTICSKDLDWLEIIRDYINPLRPFYKKNGCFEYAVSDIKSMNWLISYGCTPRKSKTLEITKQIPTIYQKDFIRGVLDGDGSISTCRYKKIKNNKEYFYTKITSYICSSSYKFLEQIKAMIPQNINCYIINCGKNNSIIRNKKVIATCNIYRLCFNDSYAKKLFEWIYYPEHKISLPRKRNLALSLI